MSSGSQPNAQDADGLEAAVDQAIAACGGDMRSTIRALSRAGQQQQVIVLTCRMKAFEQLGGRNLRIESVDGSETTS